MNRMSIFVDGNNMFYAHKKMVFDPKRVLEYFKKEQIDTMLMPSGTPA